MYYRIDDRVNITQYLQELDELIVSHTSPPVTVKLRNKLHVLREQMESYIGTKEQEEIDHGRLVEAHQELQRRLAQVSSRLQESTAEPVPDFRRGLYYLRGQAAPLCPHCFEVTGMKLHLNGPSSAFNNVRSEIWNCLQCGCEFRAHGDGNFRVARRRR